MTAPKVELINDPANPKHQAPDQPPDTPPTSIDEPEPTPTEEPKEPKEPDRRDSIIQTQQAVITEGRERIESLEERLSRLEAGPPPSPEEQDKKFWKNPTQTVRDILAAELKDVVAPLTDFARASQHKDAYAEIKDSLRRDPMYKDVLDRAENYVDQTVEINRKAGQEPTAESVKATILSIRGAAAMNMIPGLSFSNDAPVTPKPNEDLTRQDDPRMDLPAHLRPTPTTPPRKQDPNSKIVERVRNATENERRLAKELGMSLEDYFAGQDFRPEEVVNMVLPSEEKK